MRQGLAIKELRTNNPGAGPIHDPQRLFRTEALILSRLTHPNLPKVTDYFSRGGSHYIVMEYVHGRTLEQMLGALRGKPADERLALSWALQICRAMHFLSVQKPRPIVFRGIEAVEHHD